MTKQTTYPEELTDFIPENFVIVNLPTWKIVENESTVEMVRNSYFNKITIFITFGCMLFCVFVAVAGFIFSNQLPAPVSFFCTWVIGVGLSLFFLVVIPLLCILGIWANSLPWHNKARFCFNKNTGEIDLPREEMKYLINECQEIVLGCTTGFNMTSCWRAKNGKIMMPGGSFGGSSPRNPRSPITTLFLLVKKNDHWVRHLLAYDLVKGNAAKAIKILQPLLECEVVTRYVDRETCFEEHERRENKRTNVFQSNSLDKDSNNCDIVGTETATRHRHNLTWQKLLLPITFFILGSAILGFALSGLINGHASTHWPTTEATIIQSKIEQKRVHSAERHGFTNKFRPSVEYIYSVDGKEYQGNRITATDRDGVSREHSQSIIDSYPVDSTVKVYYSADQPENSVLVPGIPNSSYLLCILGLFFVLVSASVYFLFRTRL